MRGYFLYSPYAAPASRLYPVRWCLPVKRAAVVAQVVRVTLHEVAIRTCLADRTFTIKLRDLTPLDAEAAALLADLSVLRARLRLEAESA